MADVNSNVNINIDTSQAEASLRRLQSQISTFNRSFATVNSQGAQQAQAMNRALMDGINATRMFNARIVPATTTVERFSGAIEKGRLSIGEYSRYAASQLPGMRKVFAKEFGMMEKIATERVKKMQTQYIALGKSSRGLQEALAITPTALKQGYGTDMTMALQRQQLFNKMLDDGSTKLLNWGKNTQWAGRQLMVGFTLPLAALGTVAAQTFMELDKASVAFERVYGNLSTTTEEMNRNKEAVMSLGREYTRYGISVAETLDLAADVAATGAQNADLIAGTEQTLRLATLGLMEYGEALDATIALQTAFNVSNKDLSSTIDFLNVVENETILTMQDMAAAIPRVAPVVKGLGGDVKDLAVFMTAMREGGVTAEQGANALKSGLGRLINPTRAAKEQLAGFGINLDNIIQTNRGDLMGMVNEFGRALSSLGEFEQQQALEKVFGKYQYARLGALFKNIASESSQAAKTIDLTAMSVEELAQISERELSKIEQSTTVQFQKALEQLKLSIAPLGEAFMKGVMPIMEFLANIANAFNNLPDPVKNAVAVITGVVGGLGPVFLMTIGLIGNGLSNLVKGIQFVRRTLAKIRGDASAFEFLSSAEIEAQGATRALDASMTDLTSSTLIQRNAMRALNVELERYAAVAGIAASRGGAARGGGGAPPLRMATGGVVPGSGSGDKIPALLEPGETVVTKQASQRYGPVLAQMNSGNLPGFQDGVVQVGSADFFDALGMSEKTRQTQSVQRFSARALQQELEITADELSNIRTKFEELGNTAGSLKTSMKEVIGAERTPSMRAFNRSSMGGGQKFTRQSKQFYEQGMFAGEEDFIRQRMGDAIDADLFNIETSHIEKEVVDGVKQWRPENLMPDFKGVNQTLENRMRSYNSAIEKGTISISETAGLMRAQTPDLLEGLSADEVEFELDRLRQGLHPATERATRVSTSFAELDAALSREAAASDQRRTRLGTRSATGKQAEFLAASGQYRLGEGYEEFFGEGGRSQQRYSEGEIREATEQGRRNAEAEMAGREQVLGDPSNDPYMQARSGRNSPHVQAPKDGRQDAKAYIKARESELDKLRQANGMSAKERFKRSQSEARGMKYRETQMKGAGMTSTQISRQERRLLESKIKQEQVKLKEAKRAQQLAAQSAKIATQTNAAAAAENISRTARLKTMGARAAGAVGRRSGMLGMALGMGSMVPMMQGNMGLGMGMMGAGMGLEMLTLGRGAGAAGGLAKLAPALAAMAPPVLAATAAIGALAIGAKIYRERQDEAARAAATMAANAGVTANALNTAAQILGKMTPAQRRAQQTLQFSEQEQENAAQFAAFFESEDGKSFIEDLENATSAERFQKLSDYLKSGIAAGIMDEDVAGAFAKSMAVKLGDAVLGVQLQRSMEGQGTGAQSLLEISRRRRDGQDQLRDAYADVNQPGSVSVENAGQIVGSALQNLQDFSNVIALAEEEYAAGTLEYEDYNRIVSEARSGMDEYTKALIDTAGKTADVGSTMQAIRQELLSMGMSEEEQKRLQEAASEDKNIFARMFEGYESETRVAGDRQREVAGAAAYAGGMDLGNIETILDYIANNPDSEAARTFDKALAAGMEGQAVALAGATQTALSGNVGGLSQERDQELYVKVLTEFVETGGSVDDFTLFIESLPEEKKVEILAEFGGLTPAEEKALMRDVARLRDIVGPAAAADIATSEGFEQGDSDRIIGDLERISNIFGGDQEKVQKYVEVFMEESPEGWTETLPQMTKDLEMLDQIPRDIRTMLGINLENPEDVEKYGPMAEGLIQLVPALEALPEAGQEIAISMMIDENGNVKDPITFAKDTKIVLDAIEKLSSDDKEVRKGAIVTIFQNIVGPDGQSMSKEEALSLTERLYEEFGEQTIATLPADSLTKVINLMSKINGLEEAIAIQEEIANSEGGVDLFSLQSYANAQAQKAGLQVELEQEVSAGIIRGKTPTGGGGGGGGGGGTDPFQQLKQTILTQIQMYADASAKMKDLFGKKMDFFAMIEKNKGIDDKIRQLDLTPALAEQIASMDPADAKKVLNKISKGGQLNKTGRRMNRAALAGSVSQRTSAAADQMENAQAQMAALSDLRSRGAGAVAIETFAGDPAAAKEYIALVQEAKKAQKAMQDGGKKGGKDLRIAYNEAEQAVQDYIDSVVEAQRASSGAQAAVSMEVETQTAQSAANALKQLDSLENVDDRVKRWATENPMEFATLIDGYDGILEDAVDAVERNLDAIANLDPVSAAMQDIDATRQPILDNFEALEAEFELIFLNIEQKYQELIDGAKERAEGLQDAIKVVQKEIDGLERLNDADERRIRGLNRQKELIDRQIASVERTNELDQRRIDALNRQSEMINRQVEVLDRQNELDQRREDALSRQIELMSRQQDSINDQIEAQERLNELDQRQIEEMSRADEMRQRQAEALNRELELMSRKEEDIRSAYDERIKQLDDIEKAQKRISDQAQSQLDLAKALSTGDIYAATAAAQQMRDQQVIAAREDTRTALQQGMESQVGGLRTSGGLTRGEAEGQVEGINDQSYQAQLAIRDIQDQIYARTQALIPLRDQIYAIDQNIKLIDEEILVIQDQIYEREQERIPFLDQIYNIGLETRVIEDEIYNRNLEIIPLKDTIYGIDQQILGVEDAIYARESQILDIQVGRLQPLQDALNTENELIASYDKQLAQEKASVKIQGLTYKQLQAQIQSEAAIYAYTTQQIKANNKNAAGVREIAKQWVAVAQRINNANYAARDMYNNARIEAVAKAARFTPDPDSLLPVAQQAKLYQQDIDRWLREELSKIDAARQSEVAAALSSGQQKRNAGGIIEGRGSSDSVSAMLTPGEYVVRRSMVKKYGIPMLEALNTGALPKYNVGGFSSAKPSGKSAEISAPVYNNYSVNVSVPNANVNADDVANKVLAKIKTIESKSVRGYRGF